MKELWAQWVLLKAVVELGAILAFDATWYSLFILREFLESQLLIFFRFYSLALKIFQNSVG